MKILVAEDDGNIREIVRTLFTSWGHETVTADNTDEALSVLNNQPDIDLVFTDYLMPGEGGAAVLLVSKRLRPKRPVIVASGTFDETIIAQLERLGMDEYFPKPYVSKSLKCLIERYAPSASETPKLADVFDLLDRVSQSDKLESIFRGGYKERVKSLNQMLCEELGIEPQDFLANTEMALGPKSRKRFDELKSWLGQAGV